MIGRMALAAALAATTGPALAMDDLQAMQAAAALSTIIGSEQACGLTYDQAAIAAWITANVPPERMDFASTLQLLTMGQEHKVTKMSRSALTAHCAAVAASARHNKFIP